LSGSATKDAGKEHATVMSYHDAFFLSGALLLIGAILALLVNDTKARAAMMKRVRKTADGRMVEEPAEFVLE
jgi:hypothetical protein